MKDKTKITISAGILLWRFVSAEKGFEFFLVHPGGQYNKNSYWSIPKGKLEKEDSSILEGAIREFHEEVGLSIPLDQTKFIKLDPVFQNKHKKVFIWAYNLDLGDDYQIEPQILNVEYPKYSGNYIKVQENDAGKYVSCKIIENYITKGQLPIIEQFLKLIKKST